MVGGACEASQRFGVSLGSFPSEAEAADYKERWESTTCSLVIHKESGSLRPSYKVLAGPFENYMDAWATNNALPEGFPSGRFIYKWEENEQGRGVSTEKAKALRPVPVLANGTPAAQAPEAASFVRVSVPKIASFTPQEGAEINAGALSREQQLSLGLDGKKNSDGVKALEAFLSANPTDILANAARVRLARRLMAQKKHGQARELLDNVISNGNAEEKGKARVVAAYLESSQKGSGAGYDAFMAIASDEDLDNELRSHALWVAAGSAHAAREYTSAVLTFRQLAEEAPSIQERQDARLQLCGIQMELVGRAKGTWDEVIASCDTLCDDAQLPRELRATANLMRFEAMFHAGYVDDALEACESHLELYPDIKREFVSASTWYGALLVHADRRQEGRQALEAVLEMEITSRDKFGGHEPKARAAYWLAFLALQEGDATTRDRHIDYIRTNYPKSPEAAKLGVLQPVQ